MLGEVWRVDNEGRKEPLCDLTLRLSSLSHDIHHYWNPLPTLLKSHVLLGTLHITMLKIHLIYYTTFPNFLLEGTWSEPSLQLSNTNTDQVVTCQPCCHHVMLTVLLTRD